MASPTDTSAAVTVRALAVTDLAAVVAIDDRHSGSSKQPYWSEVFAQFVETPAEHNRGVALAAELGGAVVGYLLGDVRAFEFGSESCGWVFSVGVDPRTARQGIATALLAQACSHFRTLGVTKLRTMVNLHHVDVLALFRANGFVGGPFVQLELDLEE